jgi:DNA invertase Pin-like site-specific DNA recombinase
MVVSRLDRLARSTRDLPEIAENLNEAEAGLRSLRERWADTTTPAPDYTLSPRPMPPMPQPVLASVSL